jgi:hypothetical protein
VTLRNHGKICGFLKVTAGVWIWVFYGNPRETTKDSDRFLVEKYLDMCLKKQATPQTPSHTEFNHTEFCDESWSKSAWWVPYFCAVSCLRFPIFLRLESPHDVAKIPIGAQRFPLISGPGFFGILWVNPCELWSILMVNNH